MNFSTVDIGFRTFSVCFWAGARPIDFVHECLVDGPYTLASTTAALLRLLEGHKAQFTLCSQVIIEGQVAVNRRADRIMAQLMMWLASACPAAGVRLMAARQKYTLKDHPAPQEKAARKRWAANLGLEYLRSQNAWLAERYERLAKRDDVGDCIVMGMVSLAKAGHKNTKQKRNKREPVERPLDLAQVGLCAQEDYPVDNPGAQDGVDKPRGNVSPKEHIASSC